MKDTPIQKAIADITDGEYLPAAELRWVTKILQSLLPYEMECIEVAYDAGSNNILLSDWAAPIGDTKPQQTAYEYFTQTFKTNPQGGGGE